MNKSIAINTVIVMIINGEISFRLIDQHHNIDDIKSFW